MRLGIPAILVAALVMLLTSCVTVAPNVEMTGETATVRLHDGSRAEVEILAVEDSSILCLNRLPKERNPENGGVRLDGEPGIRRRWYHAVDSFT